MADSPNSTILSRRALMASAPAVALAALPVSAIATSASANLPIPAPSARVRMNLLIEELFAVAREFNPQIERWSVRVPEPGDYENGKCALLIAAFSNPEPTGGKVEIDWRQT